MKLKEIDINKRNCVDSAHNQVGIIEDPLRVRYKTSGFHKPQNLFVCLFV